MDKRGITHVVYSSS